MGNPKIRIKSQNSIQVAKPGKLDGFLVADALKDVNSGIGTVANRLANDPNGTNVTPPNIAGLLAQHLGNGLVDIAIADPGLIQSAIGYHVEYDTNPNFTSSRYEFLGPSRNKTITLPNGTYYFKAYSQYQYGGNPSAAKTFGPVQVTGSAATSLLKTQGSGTGAPGQSEIGFGTEIVRPRVLPVAPLQRVASSTEVSFSNPSSGSGSGSGGTPTPPPAPPPPAGVYTLVPEGSATSGQNFNSNPFTFEASYWTGSAAAIDSWVFQLFPGSNPVSSGTDLELNHNTLNGAGRFHINSDMLVGPPLSATSSQNSNSFAWDVEGSYWDGATQFAIWEQALGIVPTSGDVALNSRLSIYPIFTGTAGTGDIAIGGTGVNPLQGYPVTHPYWILKAFPVGDGHTATLQHTAFTADRTITFPDGDSNTIQPLSSATAHEWVTHIDATGTQSLSQPAFADISGTAAAAQVPNSQGVISPSANPASLGVVELAVGDVIAWRNNANTGNLRLGVDAGDNLELVGGFNGINLKGNNLSQVTNLQSNSASIAHSGFVEMAVADAVAWRNNANTADLALGVDASDRLTFNGNTVAAPVYNAAGTRQNAAHIVQDTVTLVSGTKTVTLSGSAAFTSATSYSCVAVDETAAAAVKVTQTSGTSITFTGTGTDVVRFIAVGN